MSMKYRIRDTKTGNILRQHTSNYYHLWCDGVIYRDSDGGPIDWMKAEMEVAPGFYEGDHVLCFDDYKNPYIYLIEDVHTLKSIDNDYSDTLLNVGALVRVYEVIKCR